MAERTRADAQTVLGWAQLAARAAASKTDEDTVVLDVGEVLSITGYFVISGGRNPRQVRTIAEEVARVVAAEAGLRPLRTEGFDTSRWVLLDEARSYYELERLWSDVPRVEWAVPPGA